jgi:Flp pilus assembly pilin Flp
MKALARRFWRDDSGLELSEYAIMAGIIIVLVVATILLIGGHINRIFQALEGAMAQV